MAQFPSPHSHPPPPPPPTSFSEYPPLDVFINPPLNATVNHFLPPPPRPSFSGVVSSENFLPHQENDGAIINPDYVLSHDQDINAEDDSLSLGDIYISVDELTGGGDSWMLHLPPGVKFRPTDEELITYYLKPQIVGGPFDNIQPLTYADVYDYEPKELAELAKDFGDGKRYFYSRIKKMATARTSRLIKSKKGSWKQTQSARPVIGRNGMTIGYKTPLAYFEGTKKTQWLMQEFKLEHRPSHHSSHQHVLAVIYYLDRKKELRR